MITLGIDTSCDDTSVALVKEREILSNLVSSHLVHSEYGGVVPEFASRAHARLLYPMSRLALSSAGVSLDQVDVIAATSGPGLLGSLLCGLSFAKGLALASGKPFVGVNHLEGHIYSVLIAHAEITHPYLALLVSGGHTELLLVEEPFRYVEIGATLDDACGEALDKVGKLMGLGYPAGAAMERLARGSRNPVTFPRPNPQGLDFSYSGLKTAARNYLARHPDAVPEDVAAGLEEAAFDHLVKRVGLAVRAFNVSRVVLTGGVAINKKLREMLRLKGEEEGFRVFAPPAELCTDNAVMIAAAGAARYAHATRHAHQAQAYAGPSSLAEPAFDRSSLGKRLTV